MIQVTLHGAMCGHFWMPPDHMGAVPITVDLKRERARFTERVGLAEVIRHVLFEQGGDFRNTQFTADTEITFEYSRWLKPGRSLHVARSIELAECPSLASLVDSDSWTGDFFD